MKLNQLLVSMGLVVLAAAPAFAHVGVELVGVGEISKPSSSNVNLTANGTNLGSPAFASKFGTGGGILLDIPIAPFVWIQAGGLYYKRKYTLSIDTTKLGLAGTGTQDLSGSVLDIPLLVRVGFAKVLSVGLGGYYSAGLGKLDLTNGGTIASSPATTETYSDQGISGKDYGLEASVAMGIPFGPVALIADGRYKLGLKNAVLDTSGGSSFKYKDIQLLAGIRLGF